jgi:pilus assembly protein CpaB
MKRGQAITLAVAGLFAVGAVVVLMNLKPAKEVERVQAPSMDTLKVLVARQEIPLGQIVSPDNFRWQDWPSSASSAAYIKGGTNEAMQKLTGSVARAPFIPGEPIVASKLVKPGEGGVLAAILPAGMRAVSTRIKEETAAGKMILPNDHVDVLLIQRKRGRQGAEDFVVDTLFRNVRVLAIGQILEAKEGKKNAEGATATLELTPRQTELLALANSMGEITLTLRSIADIDVSKPGTNVDAFGQRGNSIRMMRYGQKSRVYGVN